ncbi:MAG: AAA family ATPase [Pseudomonadota bacterium]
MLVQDLGDITFIGTRKLKGFAEEQILWRIDRPSGNVPPTTPKSHLNEPRIVGREEELSLLHDHWKSIRRRGAFIKIHGEAGIGKSRLVRELGARLDARPEQIHFMDCLQVGNSRPLHPFVKLIKTQSLIGRFSDVDDQSTGVRAWIEERLKLSPITADIICDLVEPGSVAQENAISPQRYKSRLFETLILIIERLSIEAPSFLIIEDLHWADPTTLDFLAHLAGQIQSINAMVVCTGRPEQDSSLEAGNPTSTIDLRKLDSLQSSQIIHALTQGRDLPADITSEIAERTDGNPLFVEELTKVALEIDEKALRDGGATALRGLPTTLHGLLLSRLDRVDGVHQIAPVGAAIGRDFSRELLLQAAEVSENSADAVLARLVEMGLLLRSEAGSIQRYEFKHALVRDAAYGIMPKSRRTSAHHRIGTLLEQNSATDAVLPETLARHFDLGDAPEKACLYWHKAADQAHKASAGKEAVTHIHAALKANARTEPDGDQVNREMRLRESLRVPLILSGLGASHTLSNLERLRDLREQQGDDAKLLSVLHGLSSYHLMVGRLKDAREVAEEIIGRFWTAGETGDVVAHILGRRVLGFCSFLSGDFDEAIEEFDSVIELCATADAEKIEEFYHSDTVLIVQCMSAWALSLNGGQAGLPERLKELGQAADLSEGWCKAYAHSLIAAVFQALGDTDACLRHATQAMDLAEEHDFKYWIAWCRILRGWAIARKGRAEEGCAQIEEGIDEYTATGSLQFVPQARTLLAEGLIRAGRIAEASQVLNELAGRRRPTEIGYVDALVGMTIVGP